MNLGLPIDTQLVVLMALWGWLAGRKIRARFGGA